MKKYFFFTLFIFSLVGIYPQVVIFHGIVNDNNIRIRDSPSLDGSIIGSLNKGNEVSILGRSKNRMYLDGLDSFWLKIKQADGEGWSFGAYINLLDSQYDSLPVLDEKDFSTSPDLNYSRNLAEKEFIDKERETIAQQSDRRFYSSINAFYNAFLSAVNAKESIRPFFLNSVEVGVAETDRFFILSTSYLCDYIQSNYANNLEISKLYIHDDNTATFWVSGFKNISVFSGLEIKDIVVNIFVIEETDFSFLRNKVIVDHIILSPYPYSSYTDMEHHDNFLSSMSWDKQFYFLPKILKR